jgi:hypothetical protein
MVVNEAIMQEAILGAHFNLRPLADNAHTGQAILHLVCFQDCAALSSCHDARTSAVNYHVAIQQWCSSDEHKSCFAQASELTILDATIAMREDNSPLGVGDTAADELR